MKHKEIYFDKDLIYNNLKAKTNMEVIETMATTLYEKGFVKEKFIESIMKREEDFPTGIPSDGIKIALPHSDYKFVKRSAISVASLEVPIEFNSMEEPSKALPVRVVIMLALDKPNGHLEMLSKLTLLMKDRKKLTMIAEAKSKNEIYEIIYPYIS